MYTLTVEARQDLPNPNAYKASETVIVIGTASDLRGVRALTRIGKETLDHYRRAGFLARFNVVRNDA